MQSESPRAAVEEEEEAYMQLLGAKGNLLFLGPPYGHMDARRNTAMRYTQA